MKQNTILNTKQNVRPLIRSLHFSIRLLIGVLMAVPVCTGCVKRNLEMRSTPPLLPGEGYADIALRWDSEVRPQEVRFLFYDESGALVKAVAGLAGGFRGALPAGKYCLVVHNTDALHVDYRGTENYETAEVFAQEKAYTGDLPPGERTPCILLEPETVFGTGVCNEWKLIEIIAGKVTQATVTPVELTRKVRFHFSIRGDAEVASLTGVLNGVAPGIFLSSGKHNASASCAVEFTATAASRAPVPDYTARISLFNLLTTLQSPDRTNTIHAALVLDNGRKLTTEVDLTPLLREIISGNGGQIPIEIAIAVTFTVKEAGLSSTVGKWTPGAGGGTDVN